MALVFINVGSKLELSIDWIDVRKFFETFKTIRWWSLSTKSIKCISLDSRPTNSRTSFNLLQTPLVSFNLPQSSQKAILKPIRSKLQLLHSSLFTDRRSTICLRFARRQLAFWSGLIGIIWITQTYWDLIETYRGFSKLTKSLQKYLLKSLPKKLSESILHRMPLIIRIQSKIFEIQYNKKIDLVRSSVFAERVGNQMQRIRHSTRKTFFLREFH